MLFGELLRSNLRDNKHITVCIRDAQQRKRILSAEMVRKNFRMEARVKLVKLVLNCSISIGREDVEEAPGKEEESTDW